MTDVSGLNYVSNFLTNQECESLLHYIDSMPWMTDLKRRVQHYGYRYDYKLRAVDYSMYLGELPFFISDIADKLISRNLVSERPDQAIVNEYLPGQGISAHIDCEPCFKDTIVTISLGWPYEMEFFTFKNDEKNIKYIQLEVGSALVISGEARYERFHQIRGRKKDHSIPRQRRVSLTFRNVILENTND
ncbi:MAG: alpha-ketoglutarate-dependent dioxygenase AlkB [Crenarchaeota archaeon]|nr:MAG: alpha-ketoglutarate-dependent dioxygenase AlkB [Thermoproteota archaeon]